MPEIRERRWARRLLALLGWRVEVVPPPGPKCVVAVYPHTSNWDFFVGYLAKLACGLPLHFVGKHTIFRWPLGPILRRMGGIPVDRRRPGGLLPQLVRAMQTRPWMWLAIAPEGTRAYVDHWKSGFYRLAVEVKVPIGLAFIDWRARVVGLTTYFVPTGDEAVDLARIRATYAERTGKRPELAGAIRFRAARPSPPGPPGGETRG
jgi:1-acyl-sn-glycerol-3-phosphate acyltransferase